MKRFFFASINAVCVVLPAVALAQDRVSAQRASVAATGYASMKQNRAWVEIHISAEEKDPPAALSAHAKAFEEVLDQLAAKGYAALNVETGRLAIQPRFEVRREGAKEIRGPLIGYRVTKPVFVFLDAPEAVVGLVAQFPLTGAVRVGHVGFYSDAVRQTQNAAIADGISRAQAAGEVAARATNRACEMSLGRRHSQNIYYGNCIAFHTLDHGVP